MKRFLIGVLSLALMAGVSTAATIYLDPDGNGAYVQWNANFGGGCVGYNCVDEGRPPSTVDYLYTKLGDQNSSFTFEDLPGGASSVSSVTVRYYATRYASGANKFYPIILVDGSPTNVYFGREKSTTSSWAYYSQTWNTNPRTGAAWTVPEVNSLRAGMQSSSINGGARIAQVDIYVVYN